MLDLAGANPIFQGSNPCAVTINSGAYRFPKNAKINRAT
jgi:hypothetical protein